MQTRLLIATVTTIPFLLAACAGSGSKGPPASAPLNARAVARAEADSPKAASDGRPTVSMEAAESDVSAAFEEERVPSGSGRAPPPAPMMSPPPPGIVSSDSVARPTAPAAPATGGEARRVPVASPAAGSVWAPQSPSIKAGEWDDNANYREFLRWLATEDGAPFHRVDISERRFLVVRDAQGKAVPRCAVTVLDGQQRSTTLTTNASGRAILFPHGEGLTGRELTASATCEGSTARARFSLGGDESVVDLKLGTTRNLPPRRMIDVAFILDTTGSMSEEIAAVKSTIQKVASALERGDGDVTVRIGMVAYKDRGDEYVTRVYPMTMQLGAFQRDVSDIAASGGGDTPESVSEAVHVALSKLEWNQGAVARFAFLVGDAPPHLDYPQDFDYAADMRTAAHRGIQIFTVAASGMDDLGQVVWRQIAAYTDATNLFVLRGGAGPQSTGAGDPKSSCGGTQKNYTSGQLDALILGKIRHELAGIDRDPGMIPGLRVDENAKPCSDRVLAID
jgi:uncharacterized protein YegL